MRLSMIRAAMIAALSVFVALPAAAQDLTFVNPGSEEGMLRQVLNDIGTDIPHGFVQANTPVAAMQYLTDGPALTIWSSEWVGNPEFKSPSISDSNLVGLLQTETIMCSREFGSVDDMKGKTVKLATWGSQPVSKFITNFGKQHGITFVVVPYDGSGATVRGYLGKDADTVFTISSKESAISKDSGTKCFAYSKNGDLDFRFVDAIVGVNLTPDQITSLRDKVKSLSQTPAWLEKYSGTTTVVDSNLSDSYQKAVSLFAK